MPRCRCLWTGAAARWRKGSLLHERQNTFVAHEHWESVWLKCEEPEKTFLQALIQITAAFHHFQRKNFRGAASLLRGALRRLDAYPDAYGGIEVEAVRKSVREWLRALDEGEPSAQMPIPRIR